MTSPPGKQLGSYEVLSPIGGRCDPPDLTLAHVNVAPTVAAWIGFCTDPEAVPLAGDYGGVQQLAEGGHRDEEDQRRFVSDVAHIACL